VLESSPLLTVIALTLPFCGFVLGWFIFRNRQPPSAAAGLERAAGLELRNQDLGERLQTAERTRDELRPLLSTAEARIAQLETTLTLERRSAEEKISTLTDAQQKLTETFKALSADALRNNNQSFLDLAKTTLEKAQKEAEATLDSRREAVDLLVKPIKESLQKVDEKIAEIEKTRTTAYSALTEQLKSLTIAQHTLNHETTRLSTALSGTKTAGTWGELQLRRVVELAGMVEHCDFTEQESSSGLRPDMVVRLPFGQQIVVDAKAPTDAYREAAVTTDPDERKAKLLMHAAKVRGHVDALAAKAYWEQFQPSPELVVLFLPGDQFLSAALEADPALIDRGIQNRVLLATPSTLVALLKAAAYGWRQEKVAENAAEIRDLGIALHDRLRVMADHFESLRKSLQKSVESYNSAAASLESRVLVSARKLSELGAGSPKEIESVEPIDVVPRALQSPTGNNN
jgi:DNA recombination protein RmuC